MIDYVNISTARKRLPALFDTVTARDGAQVSIRRRDSGAEAVLVSRDYLDRLEHAYPHVPPGEAFRLIGSGKLLRPGADVINEIRAEAASESLRRANEMAAHTPAPRPTRVRKRPAAR